MRYTPIQYIDRVRPELIRVIAGIIIAIIFWVKRLTDVSSSFALANLSSWYFSALYARTTLTPLRFSLATLFMLSVRDCIFLKPGTTSTNRMVMSTSKNATATPVAADQARFLFIILVIAQAAIIGAFTLACKPIAITICTCDMSLVERVMRLAVENLPISSIENEITLSYTASLSLFDRPAATCATK